MGIGQYEQDWGDFKAYIENKAKDRCILTNKNWMKLREYHMDNYLQGHKSPFGFLFKVRFFHPDKYKKIHCFPFFYHIYREQRLVKFTRSE